MAAAHVVDGTHVLVPILRGFSEADHFALSPGHNWSFLENLYRDSSVDLVEALAISKPETGLKHRDLHTVFLFSTKQQSLFLYHK